MCIDLCALNREVVLQKEGVTVSLFSKGHNVWNLPFGKMRVEMAKRFPSFTLIHPHASHSSTISGILRESYILLIPSYMAQSLENLAVTGRSCAAAWLLIALSGSVSAANWPGWRGPEGSGISVEKNLPLHWSTNENVRWRVSLPDPGNSTPVVWGKKVFLTQAINTENRRMVMCLHRGTGRLLWRSGATWAEQEPKVDDNPPCTPSPATDGRRVIVWFGSAGVYCYDFEGRELWHRDLGPQMHQWGYASSPVLYKRLCLLNFGPGDRSFVVALDKKTGRIVWKFDVPSVPEDIDRRELSGPDASAGEAASVKLSEIAGSWATPLIVPATGHDELVVALPLRLVALAPHTGELLWNCEGPNIGAYSSPFYGEGFVECSGSGFLNNLMVVQPGGRGDVTKTKRLWLQPLANSQTHFGAGVILGNTFIW
jgi:hypothetical protein